jgi:prepilin-type N-terminal cleavage/methylation domain-containing protein
MGKKLAMNNRGFTIVELMIAVSVFSMILLLTTVGMVQISKAYYKGIVQATTQQTARNVINSVAQNVQFSSFTGITEGLDPSGTYGSGYVVRSFCVGDQQQYSYITGYQQSAARGTGTNEPASDTGYTSKHVLWQSPVKYPNCAPANLGVADPGVGKELLEEKMRLTNFKIEQDPLSNDPSLIKISVTIIYGDEDLIDKNDPVNPLSPLNHWKCKATSGAFSSAFCAKSEMSTVVGKRLSLGIE